MLSRITAAFVLLAVVLGMTLPMAMGREGSYPGAKTLTPPAAEMAGHILICGDGLRGA